VITIQVGQCGNQVGGRFWDLVLREHAHVSKVALFDAALSSFFRNVDSRHADPPDIPAGDGRGPIRTLRARSILVDMEQGVVNSLLSGPLADLFEARQCITDVSGSGNNWSHGHCHYGPMYRDTIEERVRQQAEHCDSLQCFLLVHSLGGGTGSGLGTFFLETLEELYPEDDDVITSPYNATLALRCLINSAHCVLPVSNDALVGICNQISAHDGGRPGGQASLIDLPQDSEPRRAAAAAPLRCPGDGAAPAERPGAAAARPRRDGSRGPGGRRTAHSAPPAKAAEPAAACGSPAGRAAGHQARGPASRSAAPTLGAERPYDRMNSLVAHLLNNLTSSMRFEGSLNLDLNEITMNLVPFPRMHFLLSSMSPLCFGRDPRLVSRGFQQTFADTLTNKHQLMNIDPRGSTYAAMAFLVRGSASIADVNRNVTRVRKQLKMLPYNEDAFKIGLCAVPPRGLPYSVLGLANSCAAHHMFGQSLRSFSRLYSRKAHVHHYTEYMDQGMLDEAFDTVNSLMKEYVRLDVLHQPPARTDAPIAPGGAASLLLAPSAWASREAALQAGGPEALRRFVPQPLISGWNPRDGQIPHAGGRRSRRSAPGQLFSSSGSHGGRFASQ
ncbi:unnamed protein product, partial [Prorocentrum cordatum]